MSADNNPGFEGTHYDELPFLALPEPEKLKRLDRLKRELGELNKRFYDRLVWEARPLTEQYRYAGLSLICYFNRSRNLSEGCPSLGAKANADVVEDDVIAFVYEAKPSEFRHDDCGDEKVVFVGIVERANAPQTHIASVVNSYFVEEDSGKIGDGLLYKSIRGMGSRIVPVFGQRKSRLRAQNLDHEVVQCGSQVVNHVTDHKRCINWRRAAGLDINRCSAGIHVVLYRDRAEICLDEGLKDTIELLDVAVGPLNL